MNPTHLRLLPTTAHVTFFYLLGGVQVLQREKIKAKYQISHLYKIVRTLSPPTDFPLAVPSPPGKKIIRLNIEYRILCCADAQHLVSRISKVLDCRRDCRPPRSSTSLSSCRPLYPTAAHRRPLTAIARRCPPPRARGRPQQCPQIMAGSP